jgi:NitT/TauT family transport system ATP-binding protein
MSHLSLKNVSRLFGAFKVLDRISLEVNPGEFISIVGPSGCGKSTLLQVIGALLQPSSGAVVLGGKPVRSPPREMVYLFQQYNRSLFPWRTVRRNIAFGLERIGLSQADIDHKSNEYIELIGLGAFADHFPYQLSGGMQQRVAVARALAYGAHVLLMDEPFGSLDAQTRAGLQDLLLKLWQERKFTVLFVTHDIEEAIYLGQKILILSKAPATIRSIVDSGLAYPRHQIRSKETDQFLAHRREVYSYVFPYALEGRDLASEGGAP